MNTPIQAASAALTPLSFETHQVRILMLDGAPWFVGRDAAEILGYTNPAQAIRRLCKGGAKHAPLQTAGGVQELRIISEPDLFRLIVNSKLPAAERFERWVFEEVLPTIRKTGGYGTPAPSPVRLLVTADAAGTHIAPVAAETIVSGPAELANAIGCCGLTNLQLLAVMGVCAKMLRDSAKSDLRKTRAEKTRVMKSINREISV